MSKPDLKVVEGGEQSAAPAHEPQEQAVDFTEGLPPVHIDPTSFDARVAGVEPCSVVREISKHWSCVAAYEVEQEVLRGEVKSPEGVKTYQESWEAEQALTERKRELWRQRWKPKPDGQLEEHIRYIKRKAAQYINWGDIGDLWNASPRDAIELWKAIRLEARDEFISGHYGARAFEVLSWQHEAWRRAQYLAVRDGLIEEWKPRGASEFILIDQMTQSYVMQLHWTEVAMTRAHGDPRTETYEYRQWMERRKVEDRVNQWHRGDWDIPYQHQADAIEQANRLIELWQKSFQRAARQLANIRLVRAKTARARRRERMKTIKSVSII